MFKILTTIVCFLRLGVCQSTAEDIKLLNRDSFTVVKLGGDRMVVAGVDGGLKYKQKVVELTEKLFGALKATSPEQYLECYEEVSRKSLQATLADDAARKRWISYAVKQKSMRLLGWIEGPNGEPKVIYIMLNEERLDRSAQPVGACVVNDKLQLREFTAKSDSAISQIGEWWSEHPDSNPQPINEPTKQSTK